MRQRLVGLLQRMGIDWNSLTSGDILDAYLALALGVIGISVAILSFRLTLQQTRIAERQGQIAERQAEIAETQHKIFEDQRAKVAILELKLYVTEEETAFWVGIKNTGKASARDFYWRLYMPKAWENAVKFEKLEHQLLDLEPIQYDKINWYLATGGLVTTPTYPGRVTLVARLRVDKALVYLEFDPPSDNRFRWFINSEAGRFPVGQLYGVADFMSPTGATPDILDLDERQ
jgi:hypothetical protein